MYLGAFHRIDFCRERGKDAIAHDRLLALIAEGVKEEFAQHRIERLPGPLVHEDIDNAAKRIGLVGDRVKGRLNVGSALALGEFEYLCSGVRVPSEPGVRDRVFVRCNFIGKRDYRGLRLGVAPPLTVSKYVHVDEVIVAIGDLDTPEMNGLVRPFAGETKLAPCSDRFADSAVVSEGVHRIQLRECDLVQWVFLIDDEPEGVREGFNFEAAPGHGDPQRAVAELVDERRLLAAHHLTRDKREVSDAVSKARAALT